MKPDNFLVESAISENEMPPQIQQEHTEKLISPKSKPWIWVLVISGLLAMLFFIFVVLPMFYLLFFCNCKTGFEVVLKGAPPRSDVLIDGSNWGVISDDGTIRLEGLRAGETKKIEIKNPKFKCEAQEIKGNNGDSIAMIARCVRVIEETIEPQKSATPRPFDKSNDCIYNGKCKDPTPKPLPPNIHKKPIIDNDSLPLLKKNND